MSLSVTEQDFAQWRDNHVTRLFFEILNHNKEYYISQLMDGDYSKNINPLLTIGAARGAVNVLSDITNIRWQDVKGDDNES